MRFQFEYSVSPYVMHETDGPCVLTKRISTATLD